MLAESLNSCVSCAFGNVFDQRKSLFYEKEVEVYNRMGAYNSVLLPLLVHCGWVVCMCARTTLVEKLHECTLVVSGELTRPLLGSQGRKKATAGYARLICYVR